MAKVFRAGEAGFIYSPDESVIYGTGGPINQYERARGR